MTDKDWLERVTIAYRVYSYPNKDIENFIQAVSKISRFGIDNLKPGKPKTNREHLEEELGDMMAMIDILIVKGIVSSDNLEIAKLAKIEKLKKWSKIYGSTVE